MNAVLSPHDGSRLRTKWTILSLLEWSANHLAESGFDEARLHVELLLTHVLRCSRLQLYTGFDKPLALEELSRFKDLFKRRLAHEPLQYIVGETEFMGIPLFVDARVLIPRPETEQLVERALDVIKSLNKEKVEVLDIGTGSGNIAVAIAKFAPSAHITSIDVSAGALAVARTNAARNGINTINFIHANILSDALPQKKYDVVVSNPPYISLQEFNELEPEVRDFEPRIATTDEGDGLAFIRRIAHVAMQQLNEGGFLLMEIAYNQSEPARQILLQAHLTDVEVIRDYAGHPRILSARKL